MRLLELFNRYKQTHNVHLKEGLIVSQSVEKTIEKLTNNVKFGNFDITQDPDSKLRDISFITHNINQEQFQYLHKLINSLGWYISMQIIDDKLDKFDERILQGIIHHHEYNTIELELSAKYDIQVTTPPKLLYHATPTKYIEKILKVGLVPYSKNELMDFPSRIYFSSDLNSLENALIPHLSEINDIDNWTILKLDTININRRKIRWYRDSRFPTGYYTMNNIPPIYLSILKQVNI